MECWLIGLTRASCQLCQVAGQIPRMRQPDFNPAGLRHHRAAEVAAPGGQMVIRTWQLARGAS
jgi:hypothetical protein